MQITFLGTGSSQGIPIIGCKDPVCLSDNPKDKRLRSSVMVQWNNSRYIVDTGPDFRQQMLYHCVDRIDGVFFTHEHSDHVLGFDDIRPFNFNQPTIPIYGQQRVLDAIKSRFSYFFDKELKYPGAPSIDVHAISDDAMELDGCRVQPIRVYHGGLPIYGYRFGDFSYITDAKTISEKEREKLKGSRVLVVNALRKKPHKAHFDLEEALEFVEDLQPEKAYFTHISHWLGFHEEVEKELPKNVHLAYDNLKLNL